VQDTQLGWPHKSAGITVASLVSGMQVEQTLMQNQLVNLNPKMSASNNTNGFGARYKERHASDGGLQETRT
jgi:hypothetical protein